MTHAMTWSLHEGRRLGNLLVLFGCLPFNASFAGGAYEGFYQLKIERW